MTTEPRRPEHTHPTPDDRSDDGQHDAEQDPAAFWNELYRDTRWSGNVNATFTDVAAELTGATALDLGCGEGADAIWLASRGWRTTGVDISTAAVRRAQQAAASAGLNDDQLRFVVHDLATWRTSERFDLVAASFLHSPIQLQRTEILRRAAERVSPGGHLLIIGHAAPPPWANEPDEHSHEHGSDGAADMRFHTASDQVIELGLDDTAFRVVLAEDRERSATAPDGEPAKLLDAVVLVQRRP